MTEKIVAISPRPANLKRRLRKHLLSLGFGRKPDGSLELAGQGKDVIRRLHNTQRNHRIAASKGFIQEKYDELIDCFASGTDVVPERVTPVLQRISADTWESDLFRMACLTWAVPVSNGFGRRLRYLVWDASNDKLMGLIAIGDPVFNLSVRDNLIGWSANERSERLVNILDAYVLGAVPPYNMLLGGKIVSALIRIRDIYDDFSRIYGGTTGIISGKEKKARLLAVTTSSSLGRSSVYNRLKLDGIEYFKSIGYTGGWGHFHIPDDLFWDLRAHLRDIGHPYADLNRFGQGPNWRLRTTRAALSSLGLNEHLLRHGIQREVFLCEMASNALKILRTGKSRPDLSSILSASEVGQMAVERWVRPRSDPPARIPSLEGGEHRNPAHRAEGADQMGGSGIDGAAAEPGLKDMPMPLDAWHQRLESHYAALAATRSALGQPLFALEHGLSPEELEEVFAELRRRPSRGYLLRSHTLLWVVYATEFGYAYAGDEYWPSFENGIPGWEPGDHRSQLKSCFKRFADKYSAVIPTGRWAAWFTNIAWPITHAILPKYLQLQFARVLHAARYDLAGVTNLTPAAAGRLLSSHAYSVSRRFEEFLEQEELAGRILLAILADNPSPSHSPIHLPTLQRVVRDLERERRAREYLKETRQFISARIKGAGRGLEPAAPRDYARNPAASGHISIRPSLMLRRSGPSEWTPLLDFPSLADVAKRDPGAKDFLRTARCKVSGADDTWLPAGWLSSAGQRLVLRTWPAENKPLLSFETDRQTPPRFLSNLLEAECRLNPGSIWACRIRADGLAEETVGRTVRPGQQYVLLSRQRIPASDALLSPCIVHCDGIFPAHLKMPDGMSAEHETFSEGWVFSRARRSKSGPRAHRAGAGTGKARANG